MRENFVKHKLYSGQVSIGTFVMEFNTPGIACILDQAGADFVVYDMEHGGFGTDTIRQLMSYNRGLNILPFVRVPDTQYDFIARTLDAGAKGIMVPSVETRQQAEEIISCCKYSPLGKRGITTNAAHDDFSSGSLEDKMRKANEETLVIVQIETVTGVENIEEIMTVEGIDVAWIGHNDLSVSMGIPGQVTHPRVIEAMEHVANVCNKHGKSAGWLASDADSALTWINKGYRCLAYSNDKRLLQDNLKKGILQIKK